MAEDTDKVPEPEPEVKEPVDIQPAPVAPEPKEIKAKEPEPEPQPEPKPAATTHEPDWRDKRIDVLTAKLREAQSRITEPPPPPTNQPLTEAEVERRADIRARQLAAVNQFNRDCNNAVEEGRAKFPETFDVRTAQLKRLADANDPQSVSQYNSMLVAALATGKAPEILHVLGGDLNEAMRVMNLPPTAQAIELAKLSMKGEEVLSAAPKPITPIGRKEPQNTEISPDDPTKADNLGIKEWMRRRNAQVEAREPRRGRA